MKLLKKENRETVYNLELTETELLTILCAMGATSDDGRRVVAREYTRKYKGIEILNVESSHDLYKSLEKICLKD